jgi:hypothetical protein
MVVDRLHVDVVDDEVFDVDLEDVVFPQLQVVVQTMVFLIYLHPRYLIQLTI